MKAFSDVVRALASQERAVANARRAATELSRLRVEREDVELYLADRGRRIRTDEAREADGTRGLPRR
jgi:hypothetical protein